MFKFFLLAILLLTIAPPSYSSESRTATIIGLRDCETWTIDRKEATNGTGMGNITNTTWVLGFLSGLNAATSEKKDILKAIDSDTVALWIDKYCIQNPKNDTADAATKLFLELVKIAR